MHIYIHKYAQIYDNMHAIERERGLGWGYKFIYKRGALPDSFTVFPSRCATGKLWLTLLIQSSRRLAAEKGERGRGGLIRGEKIP